MSKKDLKY